MTTVEEESSEADDQAAEDGANPEERANDSGTDPDSVIPAGRASGYKHMAARPGALQYQPTASIKEGELPNKVDLRPLMTAVEDQGDTSSCVANAVAGAYDYWIKKEANIDQSVSRLFVYYNARWRDGSQDKDEGSVIQLAMESLSTFGACNETVWPFDKQLIFKKPGADAYKDGAAYRVHDMAQVPLTLDLWKQALAEGKPIVFGCELFDSFDQCSQRGGVVPMPAPDDVARAKHSGHSMCAVGYSDSEKVFIVRNSWGADWGDKGYCYMPYAYLMNPKFNDGDCWVFVPKVPLQPPREVWSDTTEPVTNNGQGVDFDIEAYSVEDYEHIAIDLFDEVRRPFNATAAADYAGYVSSVSKSLWSELESFDVAETPNTDAPADDTSASDNSATDSSESERSDADTSPPPTPPAEVDVAAILDGLQEQSDEELDWRKSTVDLLKLLGQESSLSARKDLAEKLDYDGDTDDSAAMNAWLHKEVMAKLAENGGTLPDDF